MDGFKTCADVAKAEAEGEVVFYTTDPPQWTTEVMNDFMQAFPKIKATFLRLQAGNLYQRLMSEMGFDESYSINSLEQIADYLASWVTFNLR